MKIPALYWGEKLGFTNIRTINDHFCTQIFILNTPNIRINIHFSLLLQ